MNEKVFTNSDYSKFIKVLTNKICNGEIIGKKNEDGTYTAITDYTISDYCKDNNISFQETLKAAGLKKNIGDYTIGELKNIEKDYTYGTDTAGIQVDLILSEYLRQNIIMSLNKNSNWRKLVSRTIPVDSQDIRITYELKETDEMVKFLNVAEGENLPKLTNLGFGTEMLTLGKVGGELVLTYEVVSNAKINILNVHYRAIARKYDATKDENIIKVIKNGHVSSAGISRGGAVKTSIPAVTVANLLPIKKYFEKYGINFKYLIMNEKTLKTVLESDDFSSPIRYDTSITGDVKNVIGLEVLNMDVADNEMIMIDPTQAVDQYVNKPFMTESNRNIENQTNITTFSEISGFALTNPNAVLDITIDPESTWKLPTIKEPELENFEVTSVAGTATGATKITVSTTVGTDEKLAYKASTTDIAKPTYGKAIKGYTEWDGKEDIVAGTNTKIQVVKLTDKGLVKGYGNDTIKKK